MTKKRICVMAVPSGVNVKPLLIYRGRPKDKAELSAACQARLPDILAHPEGRGTILIGREGDIHLQNPTHASPEGIAWKGSSKSGQFSAFIEPHFETLFSAT